MRSDFVFTSESVTPGHPDKLCDQISDALLDRHLVDDPTTRLDCECAIGKGILFVAMQFSSRAQVDVPAIARRVIAGVGYDEGNFEAETCTVLTSLNELPARDDPSSSAGMMDDDAIERVGAREQVNAFGFACDQTAALMPLPIWLAHKLARRLAAARHSRQLGYLAPDGKTQVSVEFRDGRPARIHSITVVSALRAGRPPPVRQMIKDVSESVVHPAFEDEVIQPDDRTRVFITRGEPFMIGGPDLHSGLTGRKTGIDTYGEYARQSGAALSGKDPGRIDRAGAYAARHAAKNVIAAGLARACEVHLSYAIGLSRPLSVQIQTFGTGRVADEVIAERLRKVLDFRVAGIPKRFDLGGLPKRLGGSFYARLACYGQLGRMDMGLPWELIDVAEALRK